jgi:hypothetical protein
MGNNSDLLTAALIGAGVYFLTKGQNNGGGGGAYGTLNISVTPSTARVLIGGYQLAPGGTYTFAPGLYPYTVEASGYTSKSGTINVIAGQTATLTANLVQSGGGGGGGTSTGSVNLTIDPDYTTVILDGEVLNPGLNSNITAGQHSWSAAAEGYVSKTGNITVVANQTVNLTVHLSVNSGGGGGGNPTYAFSIGQITALQKYYNSGDLVICHATVKNNSSVAVEVRVVFNFYGGSILPGAGTLLGSTGAGTIYTMAVGESMQFSGAYIGQGKSDRYDVGVEVWADGRKIADRQDDDVFWGA